MRTGKLWFVSAVVSLGVFGASCFTYVMIGG